MATKIINRGKGAGGKNTTLFGGLFEKKTSLENKLIENNFIKHKIDTKKNSYYYNNIINGMNIKYFNQDGLKKYLKNTYNIETYRKPDEAVLLEKDGKYHLKILEKKNQNVNGSVEEKLKTGAFTRREYELMLNKNKDLNFKISFCFVLSKFLENKFNSNMEKYNNIKKIMVEDKIDIFYGDTDEYIENIYKWILEY